jgi:hypothetical protein
LFFFALFLESPFAPAPSPGEPVSLADQPFKERLYEETAVAILSVAN